MTNTVNLTLETVPKNVVTELGTGRWEKLLDPKYLRHEETLLSRA